MHQGHDHHHAADGAPGPGHNHAIPRRPTVQWQTPHRDAAPDDDHDHGEPDLDLVETAFVEAFATAADPTSFLRLARVPFEARTGEGARLVLLRVEVEAVTDVGAVMPHLGGTTFRYDPLPAQITSRRKRLQFVYFDGKEVRGLSLAEVRGLQEG